MPEREIVCLAGSDRDRDTGERGPQRIERDRRAWIDGRLGIDRETAQRPHPGHEIPQFGDCADSAVIGRLLLLFDDRWLAGCRLRRREGRGLAEVARQGEKLQLDVQLAQSRGIRLANAQRLEVERHREIVAYSY